MSDTQNGNPARVPGGQLSAEEHETAALAYEAAADAASANQLMQVVFRHSAAAHRVYARDAEARRGRRM